MESIFSSECGFPGNPTSSGFTCPSGYDSFGSDICFRLCPDTPDYKDQKIETEKTKTYYMPFLSLERPDFKYAIFKIVEVSPWYPPAKQHSRFGPIQPNVGRIGFAA